MDLTNRIVLNNDILGPRVYYSSIRLMYKGHIPLIYTGYIRDSYVAQVAEGRLGGPGGPARGRARERASGNRKRARRARVFNLLRRHMGVQGLPVKFHR